MPEIDICLDESELEKLDPHLPEGLCKSPGTHGFNLPECRTVPDEATYQRVLAIAEDNCPEVAANNQGG